MLRFPAYDLIPCLVQYTYIRGATIYNKPASSSGGMDVRREERLSRKPWKHRQGRERRVAVKMTQGLRTKVLQGQENVETKI